MNLSALVKSRPAETTGAGLGVATVITAIATHDVVTLAAAAAAFAPAVVTYLATHGGIRGVIAALWHGRS